MATTKGKKRGGEKGFVVRSVKSREDRKRPSVFMRLKADEAFKGVALFEPDPEMENNPGYYEYFSHWDQQGNTYVPCAGDKCPFCAANDNPSTQALTAWYFPQAPDKKDQIKIFTMNYSTTQEASDESEDEDGVIGKVIRVKRLNDKGDYRFKVTHDKPLTKKELSTVMADLEKKFPNGLNDLVLSQLKRQMERLAALEALDDDDDEDEETPKSKRGQPVDEADEDDDEDEEEAEEEADEEDEEEDEEDEDEEEETPSTVSGDYEILSARKKEGYIAVEHDGEEVKLYASDDAPIDGFKKGATVTVSADWTEEDDEDGYYLLTEIAEAEEEAEEEEEEEEEADTDGDDDEDEDEPEESENSIEGVIYEVVKIQENDEIFDLKNDDGKVKMWLGEGIEVDYGKVKKGSRVKIDAEQDDEEDWIITSIALARGRRKK